MTGTAQRRRYRSTTVTLGVMLAVVAVLAVGCGDDATDATGEEATTTTGENGGTGSLEGSAECSDPTGDAVAPAESFTEKEGWPSAFDLTGVEVAVEGEDLVVTARFDGDVTEESGVSLRLGDLTGVDWVGQAVWIVWDVPSQGWVAKIDTLPFSGIRWRELTEFAASADAGRLQARIPLSDLPNLAAPFQWFAHVPGVETDFCPDGNLADAANNPATFPG
jgi:hypothetical protein